MRVRCDAQVRFTYNSSLYGERTDIVSAYLLAAHEGVLAIKHGRVSGYEGSAAPCKITSVELVNPDDAIPEGECCTCDICKMPERKVPLLRGDKKL